MTGIMPVGDGTHACFLILVIECTLGEKMLSVEWIKKGSPMITEKILNTKVTHLP
jgi:hypothetical protein